MGMDKLDGIDVSTLKLVKYPDPRLREACTAVTLFDERLKALAVKMLEVMYQSNGVGLAAPQVGVSIRLFVADPTRELGDARVYIDPVLIDNKGTQDGEEGCLSFPMAVCRVKRYAVTTIRAQDLDGQTFEETGEELLARILQHEYDHLEGVLLVDRMSPTAKIANRRILKELEESFSG